jgi:acyl carrier protein
MRRRKGIGWLAFGGSMAVIDGVKRVLQETLQLGDRVQSFDESTSLFGSIPEFDSMAVVAVVTGLEEQFDIEVDDDDFSAEVFETLGSLTRFVEDKLAA